MALLDISPMLTRIRNWVLAKLDMIWAVIPTQASASNKLADKNFVNSSISTATATYRGGYNLVTDLSLTTSATEGQIATALASKMSALSIVPDNNDYAFVRIPTADATPTEIARIDRYKYNGTVWALEYALNNSGYTAAQWAAINSHITSGLTDKLSALPTNAELTTLLSGKEDNANKVTAIDEDSTDTQYPSAKSVWTLVTTKAADAVNAVKAWANGVFASKSDLVDGTVIPMLSTNLEPWADQEDLSVKDTFTDTIRTTAGSNPIVTESGGEILSIVPKTDFGCSKLITTGYNQLRLVSEGGAAFAVGTGFAIPVPKLTFGEYGSAKENNGMVFTNSEGENMNPTVYFKPFASGVPTSITDGTQLTAQQSLATANQNGGIYTDHNIKFYLTPGAGWLIVSGITRTTTCAHIGWEDWYDKYVPVSDAEDAGDSIDLASIFSTIHSDVNKMLVVGTGGQQVTDSAEWTSETTCKWTRRVGRLASPSWTNTQNEDGTYTHTATVTGMKSGGLAEIEGQQQALMVEGTSVSYTDENAAALSGAIKYELATEATGNLTIDRAYDLNDCGMEILDGATGQAYVTCMYAQNIADALGEIARMRMPEVVKEMNNTIARIDDVEISVTDAPVDADFDELPKMMGQPMTLFGNGVPAAATVPSNWIQYLDGGYDWNGTPSALGQVYINTAVSSGGRYTAVRDTNMGLKWVNS